MMNLLIIGIVAAALVRLLQEKSSQRKDSAFKPVKVDLPTEGTFHSP